MKESNEIGIQSLARIIVVVEAVPLSGLRDGLSLFRKSRCHLPAMIGAAVVFVLVITAMEMSPRRGASQEAESRCWRHSAPFSIFCTFLVDTES